MNLEYDKLSPGGNTTAIVRTRVSEAQRPSIAAAIMTADDSIEQVGFMAESSDADARLDMMGGELCINAVRSVAALISSHDPHNKTVRISTANLREPLVCSHRYSDDGRQIIGVTWQVEYKLDVVDDGYRIVHLGDISHVLCQRNELPSKEETQDIFDAVSKRFANILGGLLAFGVIPFVVAGDRFVIRPVVHVPAVPTTVHETGCGSGSLALAISILVPSGGQIEVVQPSGDTYHIEIKETEGKIQAKLESPVELLGRETVDIAVEVK